MPEIDRLIRAAATMEGGTAADVLGSDRRRGASRCRHAAMWLAFKITTQSLPELGRAFGRHHSTVLYGIRAYERLRAANPSARKRGDKLVLEMLKANLAAVDGGRAS